MLPQHFQVREGFSVCAHKLGLKSRFCRRNVLCAEALAPQHLHILLLISLQIILTHHLHHEENELGFKGTSKRDWYVAKAGLVPWEQNQ